MTSTTTCFYYLTLASLQSGMGPVRTGCWLGPKKWRFPSTKSHTSRHNSLGPVRFRTARPNESLHRHNFRFRVPARNETGSNSVGTLSGQATTSALIYVFRRSPSCIWPATMVLSAIRMVKTGSGSASVEEARTRALDFFREICRNMPNIMDRYNLYEVITPSEMRAKVAADFRKHADTTNSKVRDHSPTSCTDLCVKSPTIFIGCYGFKGVYLCGTQ